MTKGRHPLLHVSPAVFPLPRLYKHARNVLSRAFGNDTISLRNSSFRSPRTEFHVVLRCMYHRPICLMKPFGSVVSPPLFLGIFSFVEEGGWPGRALLPCSLTVLRLALRLRVESHLPFRMRMRLGQGRSHVKYDSSVFVVCTETSLVFQAREVSVEVSILTRVC